MPQHVTNVDTLDTANNTCHTAHCVKTRCHPQNQKHTTYCTLVQVDRAMATVNTHRKFCEVGTWFLRYASGQSVRQTDRHTDTGWSHYMAKQHFYFHKYTIPGQFICKMQHHLVIDKTGMSKYTHMSHLALCCRSNKTHVPIANPSNSALLQGTPIPQITSGSMQQCGNAVRDRQTDRRPWSIYISPRQCLTQNEKMCCALKNFPSLKPHLNRRTNVATMACHNNQCHQMLNHAVTAWQNQTN